MQHTPERPWAVLKVGEEMTIHFGHADKHRATRIRSNAKAYGLRKDKMFESTGVFKQNENGWEIIGIIIKRVR